MEGQAEAAWGSPGFICKAEQCSLCFTCQSFGDSDWLTVVALPESQQEWRGLELLLCSHCPWEPKWKQWQLGKPWQWWEAGLGHSLWSTRQPGMLWGKLLQRFKRKAISFHFLFMYLCVCVCVRTQKVRTQFVGAGSLLPPYGAHGLTLSGLAMSTFMC